MTGAMRVTAFDRLVVDSQAYRLTEKTANGCTFDSTAAPASTLALRFEELRSLLRRPNVSLERDYFLSQRSALRGSTNVDAIGSLPGHIRSEVAWRHSYCEAFLRLEQNREVQRSEQAVVTILPDIEALVNKQSSAVQGKWLPARAGTKKAYKDPPCSRTLLEWVRRFERAACSPLGLIPRTHRSGNHGARFSIEAQRLIGECLGAYLTKQRLSKRIVADMCASRFRAENEKRKEAGLPPLQVPSRRKVERDLAKLDPYSTYAQRHGVDAANRKFMLYEEGIEASYPMERIEIDEWRVDLMTILAERGALDHLTSEELVLLPRGRRWLYLAIDCATRCVVGMRLAENPNCEDAIALLADVTRDKTTLAVAAGCQSEWHHFGGLKTVATDLGAAFVDDNFSTAVFDAHGLPETPTGGLPQLRARVERIFGTFGTNLAPYLAGRTFSNPKERGDYPTAEMASITDDALIQMLILYVVDVYHNRPHGGLNGETPNNCWKRLANEIGVVPDVPERMRRRAFGKPMRRKVTGRGVRVFGIDFTCAALRQFHLHNHETDVDLRVDLNDLGWIMVRIGEEWFPAIALQKCFEGVSFDEWQNTARQLRLKYRDEATLTEHLVSDALQKIIAINAAEQQTFGAELRAVTPSGLRRAKEDLFLGLSIEPERDDVEALPAQDDLFGRIIPTANEPPPERAQVEVPDGSEAEETFTWRFDDE